MRVQERKQQAAAIARVSHEISVLAERALQSKEIEFEVARQQEVEERLERVVRRAAQLLKRVREQNLEVMQAALPRTETPKRHRIDLDVHDSEKKV